MRRTQWITVPPIAAAAVICLMYTGRAQGLDGNNALNLSTFNGWKAFELVTQGDNISALGDAGYGGTASRGTYDGLGGYLDGDVLRIFVNHETSTAAISRVELDLADFKQAIASTIDNGATPFPSAIVTGMGYAYGQIFDGTYHAVNNPNPVAGGTAAVGNYGDINFDRFCSGSTHPANTFGVDRGFVDDIYMAGEEVAGGRLYAVDAATQTLWEVPDVGLGRWENAALVDTGNETHAALVLMSDVGSGSGDYIRMYVGEKNVDANSDGEIDFLERNGMRGGTVYYFDPDGRASTTDLPDGLVTGAWSASTSGALRETKLEDVHTNPANGSQLVFADQTDGVYTLESVLHFSDGVFDPAGSTVSINQIDNASDTPIRAPDNLVWSANSKIYVQEDGDGDDMFQMNSDGSDVVQIAHAFSEPSGIVDISQLVGYQPGSVMLSSIQGSGAEGAQLTVLVSPDATLLVVPGDADGDGDVDLDDYNIMSDNMYSAVGGGAADGDFDDDGDVDFEDFVIQALNFGDWPDAEETLSHVPEPTTIAVFASAGVLVLSRRRRTR